MAQSTTSEKPLATEAVSRIPPEQLDSLAVTTGRSNVSLMMSAPFLLSASIAPDPLRPGGMPALARMQTRPRHFYKGLLLRVESTIARIDSQRAEGAPEV